MTIAKPSAGELADAELIVRSFTFDGKDGNRARKALDLIMSALRAKPVAGVYDGVREALKEADAHLADLGIFEETDIRRQIKKALASPSVRLVERERLVEAMEDVGMFFRVLRGRSELAGPGYSLEVTKADYDKARAGYDRIKALLSAEQPVVTVERPSIEWLAREIVEKATLMQSGQASYLQHIVKSAETILDRCSALVRGASHER